MIKPSCDEIMELAKSYNTIPVCKEILADVITPITLLRRIAASKKRFFLLESIEGGEKWGRYSFIGYDPIMRVSCKNAVVTIDRNGKMKNIETKKPLEVLRSILKDYKSPSLKELPPFTGGLVGYFAYSMIGYAEPKLKIKSGDFNDYDVMLFDKVIAYDHLKQKICVIVNMSTDKILENYGKATAEIEKIINLINDSSPLPELKGRMKSDFECNVSEKEYCNIVEKTKEYIRDGDIFQAVISRKFTCKYDGCLINAYRVLRTINPSPYMVYMSIDGDEIISTSPETLVKLQNGVLNTFPIAGSRPRGKTDTEDNALADELIHDEKELAEHNMLVDLGRNDIGKISEFNSVKVTKYQEVLRYSKIMHICSEVEGKLKDGLDAFDAIESLLPAGTLSGAPKIRACEIIEELERTPRGVYGGALGYVDFNGNLDTCIAIRMAVKKNDKVYVQAGAGIVADSVPESEYEETYNKALAVMNAVKNAGEVNAL